MMMNESNDIEKHCSVVTKQLRKITYVIFKKRHNIFSLITTSENCSFPNVSTCYHLT